MKAGIGESLDLVLSCPNDDVGQAGNVIDQRVAYIRDVILMASQLPDALPEPFNFKIKKVPGIIDTRVDDRWPGFKWGILTQFCRDVVCVHVQQFAIGYALGPVGSRQCFNHDTSYAPGSWCPSNGQQP